jgi:hypothetical protein
MVFGPDIPPSDMVVKEVDFKRWSCWSGSKKRSSDLAPRRSPKEDWWEQEGVFTGDFPAFA